jgi:hypothetical protein
MSMSRDVIARKVEKLRSADFTIVSNSEPGVYLCTPTEVRRWPSKQ